MAAIQQHHTKESDNWARRLLLRRYWNPDSDGTYNLKRIRANTVPLHFRGRLGNARLNFEYPNNLARAAQIKENGKRASLSRQGSRWRAQLLESTRRCSIPSSDTYRYRGKNYGLEDGRISCARLRVSGGGGMGTVGGGGGCGVESGVEKEVVDLQHLHAIPHQKLPHLKAFSGNFKKCICSNLQALA
ncbi:hypothetical protein Tco_0459655 [Tanacetum coccineum]